MKTAFLILLLGTGLAGAEAADPLQAAEMVHSRGDYESSLYAHSAEDDSLVALYGEKMLSQRDEEEERRAEPTAESRPLVSESPSAPPTFLYRLIMVLFIGALIVFFLWLVVIVIRSGGRRASTAKNALVEKRVAASRPEEPTEAPREPEDLLREGRLAEAMAALLEQALAMTGWSPLGKGKSQTAREILSKVPESDERRELMVRIVSDVEGVRFGGISATLDVYQRIEAWVVQLAGSSRSSPGGSGEHPTGGPSRRAAGNAGRSV